MQVEGGDDRFVTQDFPDPLEDPAFGIELLLACHRPVEVDVSTVHIRVTLDLGEQLSGDLGEVHFWNRTSGGDGLCGIGGDDLHVVFSEGVERTSDFGVRAGIRIQNLITAMDAEEVARCWMRVE